MKALKKIIHQGRTYYSVGDSAKYLETTAIKIRQMMGDGSLKWEQLRTNGRLLVTAESLAKKKAELPDKKFKSHKVRKS